MKTTRTIRRKVSREQLEANYRIKDAEWSNAFCALNDVLGGKVHWFRKGKVRLGISRANGPAGGLIIHQFQGYAVCHLWEEWWPGVRDGGGSTTDKDTNDLYLAALEAHQYVLACQSSLLPETVQEVFSNGGER